MKNILIISSTLKSNFKLAQDLKEILKINKNITCKIISLEDNMLPLYTDENFKKHKNTYEKVINMLTMSFINSDGIIFCAPEYNGSTPPILTNAIAWISTSTDYWRDAFTNKFAFISTSSGGPGNKLLLVLRVQLEHLGMIVHPRTISTSSNKTLDSDSVKNILKHFINLL